MALGDTLIQKGIIKPEELDKALNEQKNNPNERIGDILVKLGFTTKEQIEAALS
jgi:type IV pilus assembly protein PilB